jgi:hypothetical protein
MVDNHIDILYPKLITHIPYRFVPCVWWICGPCRVEHLEHGVEEAVVLGAVVRRGALGVAAQVEFESII